MARARRVSARGCRATSVSQSAYWTGSLSTEDTVADLADLARTHLAAALADEHGRSAELILRDGPMRQSIIALRSGAELSEHNSPAAASIQMLSGRVRVTGQDVAEISAGRLDVLTHARHAVLALEDSVFLLTTVTGIDSTGGPERAR
jgi:quercetin dioxygenase-like cupin family protein